MFPFLGITNDDYEWYVNPDRVQTSFHGLKMNPVALSKLGMLYLQNGMASNNSDPIVDPSWIKRSFTVGDTNGTDLFGYIGWWLGTQEKSNPEDTYVSYGFGGQRLAINYATQRVVAILSDTVSRELSLLLLVHLDLHTLHSLLPLQYYKDAGLDKYDDPLAESPTDQIKELFAYEEPTDNVCGASTIWLDKDPTIDSSSNISVTETNTATNVGRPSLFVCIMSLALSITYLC